MTETWDFERLVTPRGSTSRSIRRVVAGAAHRVGLRAHQCLDECRQQPAQQIRARCRELISQQLLNLDWVVIVLWRATTHRPSAEIRTPVPWTQLPRASSCIVTR